MDIDPSASRRNMVEQQLDRRGIRDPALTRAMRTVPREKFVPAELAEFAYDDSPLPIDASQTISQPYIVALMTEALALEPDDRVLEIGTGSGYAAAVLAEIASEVYTVERHAGLADAARDRLEALGYRNIQVRCGDGTLGWVEEAPFDAIAVTAGGPTVPDSLREQLAVGGRLVIPVGVERVQRLLLVRRTDATTFSETDLGPVRFVPLIGAHAWDEEPDERPLAATLKQIARRRAPTPAESVAEAAEPFDRGDAADIAPLLERIGDARIVLLGEATHGTAEFYDFRAKITQQLIEHAGVTVVAVEADWPDARKIDRFVRGIAADPYPEGAFTRFPTWMWANQQVRDFTNWLRDWNASRSADAQTGFYGLDLYSMYTSIRAVLGYLDGIDPKAAAVARVRYGCLAPWESDPVAYGAAARRPGFTTCADEAVKIVDDLLRKRLKYSRDDEGDAFFDAERNATLVRSAERYYRAMYYGAHTSWNLRDGHMYETLLALLRHSGPRARAVVWAHNSHTGNAAATAMSARGETNLGELCRNELRARCYSVGFGTDRGTVAAAPEWDAPMQIMEIAPAHEASYERVCHESGVPRFLLPLRDDTNFRSTRATLLKERLERAIGVIYRPANELASHYFHASLPRQFDEWVWFDKTRAVDVLPVRTDPARMPDTYPFGI